MAYPPHYLLQFSGTIGTDAGETWSCGIRMVDDAGGPGAVDQDAYVSGVAKTALQSWFNSIGTRIGNWCVLRSVKFNAIASTGRYLDQGQTHEFLYPGGGVIGGASPGLVLPYQCSVAVSWENTENARGLASKGRIYVPCPSVAITPGNGRMALADASAIGSTTAGLLHALGQGPAGLRPSIVSGVGAGASNVINHVRVDTIVDTQRRRRAQLRGVNYEEDVSY